MPYIQDVTDHGSPQLTMLCSSKYVLAILYLLVDIGVLLATFLSHYCFQDVLSVSNFPPLFSSLSALEMSILFSLNLPNYSHVMSKVFSKCFFRIIFLLSQVTSSSGKRLSNIHLHIVKAILHNSLIFISLFLTFFFFCFLILC